jgi:hypothetical protein
VRYLLIGGFAVGIYGYVRATKDMDIWVSDDKQNQSALRQALNNFGFPATSLPDSLFSIPGQILRMGVPPTRIEILSSISGVEFEKCYKKRKKEKIDNILVSIIDFESLLANKKASGRPRDLADVNELTLK